MIVVFDAQCLLCNGSVQFLLRHDRRAKFEFASIQGTAGAALLDKSGLTPDSLETFLLIDGEQSWQQSAAIFQIFHELGWPWRLAWIGWLVPAPLRDAAYRWLARHRYRIFGRSEVCLMPSPPHASRFLD
jgi:predicted DCC family thiol-disulfide oxidoreductase YuxK